MITFSCLKSEEQIEYVLLSSIPLFYYDLFTKKGKKCFAKDYSLDSNFLSPDRNISQIGLVYQEKTIVQLNSIFNNKQRAMILTSPPLEKIVFFKFASPLKIIIFNYNN